MPREKSAGAIIFRKEPFDTAQGKKSHIFYLLLRYPSTNKRGGHWEFAKGHVEVGENEEETVKREVFEETGINDLKIISGFKKHIKYFFRQYPRESKAGTSASAADKAKRPWIFKLVTFFVAETKKKDIKISPEHTEYVWLSIDDAIKKTTFKNSKNLLKEADEFIGQIKE